PSDKGAPNRALLRRASPAAPGAPGARGGPLGYASDLAPARCRFRSTQVLPRSTGRLVDPPASPRVPRALVSSYPDAGGAAEGRGVGRGLSGRKVEGRIAGSS